MHDYTKSLVSFGFKLNKESSSLLFSSSALDAWFVVAYTAVYMLAVSSSKKNTSPSIWLFPFFSNFALFF